MATLTITRDLLSRGKGGIAISREREQVRMPRHRHEFFEIAIVFSGTGLHRLGPFRHRLRAGDVFLINPHRDHAFEETDGLNLVNLLLHEQVIARQQRLLGASTHARRLFDLKRRRWSESDLHHRLMLDPATLDRVEEAINRLEEETLRDEPASPALCEAHLTLLLGLLLRAADDRSRSSPQRDEAERQRLGRLFSWIERHLDHPLRLVDLAAQVHCSPRTLQRLFLENLQMTPLAYVTQCRLLRAKRLLVSGEGRVPIAEVAHACGFEDGNYFSAWFHRLEGSPPREFRARQRSVLPPNDGKHRG